MLNDSNFSVATILIPLFLISLFGLLTIFNLRKAREPVEPTRRIAAMQSTLSNFNPQQHRVKKVDHRLLFMLFFQVLLLALVTLPLSIERLYITLPLNFPKSSSPSIIEDSIYQIALICTYFAAGMPFYVKTLSVGTVFDKAIIELKDLLSRIVLCRSMEKNIL